MVLQNTDSMLHAKTMYFKESAVWELLTSIGNQFNNDNVKMPLRPQLHYAGLLFIPECLNPIRHENIGSYTAPLRLFLRSVLGNTLYFAIFAKQ